MPRRDLRKVLKERPPAVAGSFYPKEREELEEQLAIFLKSAKKLPFNGELKILVVPHAGIFYSGQVAAWGFRQIDPKRIKRIVLLGASHHYYFDSAAVYPGGVWATPLGTATVDKKQVNFLCSREDKIVAAEGPHLPEHNLEVELIFLQKILPSFTIVPILVSQPSEGLIDKLAKKITQIIDGETILVVSTDLSHYPPYEIARSVDQEVINALISGKKDIFERKVAQIENSHYPGLETACCGLQAVKIGLRVGESLKLGWEKIFYQNSGDVSDEWRSVVGYAALAGIKKQ